MTKANLEAVISGDLIGSRSSPGATGRAMETLRRAADRLGSATGHELRFTRFRGDGWQVHLPDPGAGLLAMVYLRAALQAGDPGLATRIALGIGAPEHGGTNDLSDASGGAFVASGTALDTLPRTRTLAVAGTGVGPGEEAIVALLDPLTAGWTPEQAEAVALALLPPGTTQDKIARGLGITRQAVQRRLAGAHFRALQPAIAAFAHLGARP